MNVYGSTIIMIPVADDLFWSDCTYSVSTAANERAAVGVSWPMRGESEGAAYTASLTPFTPTAPASPPPWWAHYRNTLSSSINKTLVPSGSATTSPRELFLETTAQPMIFVRIPYFQRPEEYLVMIWILSSDLKFINWSAGFLWFSYVWVKINYVVCVNDLRVKTADLRLWSVGTHVVDSCRDHPIIWSIDSRANQKAPYSDQIGELMKIIYIDYNYLIIDQKLCDKIESRLFLINDSRKIS